MPEPTPSKPNRRWRSISLRAMLLLILGVGGGIGWWARLAHLQRAAVAMIEAGNGSVVYDHEILKRGLYVSMDTLTPEGDRRRVAGRSKSGGSVPPPVIFSPSSGQPDPSRGLLTWASKNLGIDFVDDVVQVLAIGWKPGEKFDSTRLADLPKLEWLNIQLKPIHDDDLVHLEGLRNLRLLCLAHTKITDAGLVHLEKLDRLEELILIQNGDAITDVGLARIGGWKQLRVLEVGGPKITDAGLAHLRELPELRFLLLMDAPNVTVRGIDELRRTVPQLKVRHPKPR